ncbi:hypothetical protein Tsubulata_029287 [Turnera subulata]|uniref:Lysosomal Pro-X carboxypeptidase n=1 Tax=Turnera subulata TaxID=218843 RepID=A0A9Q0JE77_9ROSI|nr:hypothetical protein Tsubulata_029287 [Turnera subulata]
MARATIIQPLWLPCLLLLFFATAAVSIPPRRKIPVLSVHAADPKAKNSATNNVPPAVLSEEYQVFYYNQTLDHFNLQPQSYATFPQRYVVSFKHWRGANASAPILVYMGAESTLTVSGTGGFFPDTAARFDALQVYIEHRFYGESVPFVKQEQALENATLRGYFNSAQALEDYAEIIMYIKKVLSAEKSPVIVVGGSYGGMLAAWFRLKYPHVALGALASSAPILYFDSIIPPEGYFTVMTKDFKETSENCYKIINESWSEIDRVAAAKDGLSILSKKFKTCQPLNSTGDLKEYLVDLYSTAAQYDKPLHRIDMVCKGIDSAPKGADILEKIFAGVVSYYGNASCYIHHDQESFFSAETMRGWSWQVCSDLVISMGIDDNATMFQPDPWNLTAFVDYCNYRYGVPPRPHWITTYFGGYDIKEVLRRFGSNIIFSNGLYDPYSSGGVLEDISDSILAVKTREGSHCMDISVPRKDDPEWLVLQRNIEMEIISGWLLKYYQDLLEEDAS